MSDSQDLLERRARLTAEQLVALKSRLNRKSVTPVTDQLRTIVRGEHSSRAEMSFAQQRLWFLWQMQPESAAYHLHGGLSLRGKLNREALQASIQALVDRHESLRTVFMDRGDGTAEQVVLAQLLLDMPLIDLSSDLKSDLSGDSNTVRQQRVQEHIQQALTTPFNLAAGPLLRVVLLRIAEDEHQLIVVLHHIISDAQSTAIILHELESLYRAQVYKAPADLAALSIRYSDYAVWQRQWLASPEAERQQAWWLQRINDGETGQHLRGDRVRRMDGAYSAGRYDLALGPELTEQLRQCAKAQGCTLFMVLLAGLQGLLYRHSGQDTIRVGVPIANRNLAETADIVGFFVNMQVMATRVDGKTQLADLLRQVRDTAIEAQSNQDLPFDRLVEVIQPVRSMGIQPLFQTLFNHLRQGALISERWPQLAVQRLEFAESSAQFDLSVQSTEDSTGQLRVNFTYVQELFEATSIEHMAGHYKTLLRALAQSPWQTVDEVPLLSLAEQQQLHAWGTRNQRFPGSNSIHQLIEEQARLQPSATAVIFEHDQLSYAELNTRANRLAHHLIKLGVKPEVKVGIAVERSLDMIVGLLAILKSGGAYVPLDPDYPQDRQAYIFADSGIGLVLTQSTVKDRLPSSSVNILELDHLGLLAESSHNPEVALHSDNLAYVIYTSGSTGKPKGAQLCHRNVTRLLEGTDHWFGFGPQDVWTMFHSYAFDFSVWEIFGALCTGGQLVIVPFWVSRSPEDFLQLLRTRQVTVLNQTPSAFGQLMATPGVYDEPLPLRTVIFGGEALDPQRLKPWIAQWGNQRPQLINMYGITETTVHVTYRPILEADLLNSRSPVGAAIPDLGLRVLDGALNLAPIGVAGELYVAGAGLARGYLNRAGLSAERFIADPFSEKGERLYRTGDLVRWTHEGQLEYLGRIDHQVKIRGFRIELGEIEGQLLALPEVREATVLAQTMATGTRLVGYVSGHGNKILESSILRERLGQSLPDYMIPSAIVVLDALPLNANGKVDRKALPAPDYEGQREYVAPQGELEETLAAIWAEILGVEKVGRQDNFFELGGDSILSLKVVARARAQGLQLMPRQVFEHQTLAAAAKVCRERAAESEAIPALGVEARQAALPTSYAQSRQWFLWQLEPQSTAYHISGALTLKGALDVEVLMASFNALVDRHESLRTVFQGGEDGLAVQIIQPASQVLIEKIDLSQAGSDQAVLLQAAATRLQQSPFDLTCGPLLRIGLIRLAFDEHVLVVVMHHIISDGWSMQVIVEEFVAQYQARIQGQTPVFSTLPIQYADYAVWQRSWLEAGEQERQLHYWTQHLGNEHSILQLPTDHARRINGHYSAVAYSQVLPAALVQGLHKRAQAEGATLFMVLLAGVQSLLYRYIGQPDIRVGVPIANRHRVETESVVGFFVNTQVLRGVMAGRTTLAQVLKQAQETALGAQQHQDLPFEQLVEALQPERNLGVNPLFQVLYNHQRQDVGALQQLPGLALTDYALGGQGAQFELTVDTVEDQEGQVHIKLIYARELFEAGTIERMAGHFVSLLQAFAEQPGQALGDVALLGEVESQQLAAWSTNPVRYPSAEPVHYLIESQAIVQPKAIALIFGDQQLSYCELNCRANQLAHHLIGLGVKAEVKVGVALERSVEMVVGLLAILKAGGAYVPLDPDYPQDRLDYMVADSGLALLLTHTAVKDRWQPTQIPVIDLDQLALSPADCKRGDTNPGIAVHPENLAYVIYTSGSTGKPKGAAVRHSGLTRCMAWMQDTYHLTPADTVLHKAPFGFDVSVWEIFWPLTSGVRLVVANPGDQRDPARIIELIRRHHITTLNFVPAMLQAFLAEEGIETQTRLRYVICGGEAMPAATQREALTRLPDVSLQNLYGPTETTIHVTRWTCRDDGQNLVPIGQPISDTQAYVLDESLNQVPRGVAGELYIGGELLARGYLNRPSLSAERFVADSFSEEGGRLYRTGDLVRWNAEGQLEYLGRIDHQIKIRGFRIELGEVEAQLLAQSEVREAVVVAQPSPTGTRLVGYIAAHAGQTIETSTLRERLGKVLPDYMVPSALVVLDSLPLNANGKVDRKALPELDYDSAREYVAPQGELEETLAAIWSGILGVENVGRYDNFFELGGDSILSLKVVARARAKGLQLTAKQVFEHQTLAAAAKANGQHTAEMDAIPALSAERRQHALPASYAQSRQWFLWQLEPQSTAYHISGALKLKGTLDVEVLMASFDALVVRHESLRTVFQAAANGLAMQVIQLHSQANIEEIDLGEAGSDPATELTLATERLHQTPFDLTTGPLLRIGLIRLAADDHVLVVVMHHIVSDGWSMQVIVEEFVTQYRARIQGEVPALAALPIQYADYAVWQRKWLEEGEQERQLTYWKNHLGTEHPVLQLPTDNTRRVDGRYAAATYAQALPENLVKGLHKRAQAEGATLFMVLLAGVQSLLYRYSGQPDIRVGVPIANRHRVETESVVGFFVNTQVLRAQLTGRKTLAEVLHAAKQTALGAQQHQDLPFEQLVEALQPERNLGVNPLFQVMYNHQRLNHSALQQLPGLTLGNYSLGEQAAQFELTIDTTEDADGQLRISLTYAAELFAEQTIVRMAEHYVALLQALARQPAQAVAEVALLGETEQQLLCSWGVNAVQNPSIEPVHYLIEGQAVRQPDAIALAFNGTQLTYAQLNTQANQLAHHLIKLGVKPDVKIGVAIERSLEMVVALFAIMKAGGAYVPLDPQYPQDRLAYMAEDSGISGLLTQSTVKDRLALSDAVQVIDLDTLDLSNFSTKNPAIAVHSENLAYVIYTSGSTGKPKGVAVAHGPFARHCQAIAQAYAMQASDRELHSSSINFDIAHERWAVALCSGASVAIFDTPNSSIADFVEAIENSAITSVFMTPSYANEVTNLLREQDRRLYLRLCVIGGEALPSEYLIQLRRQIDVSLLINAYGPTETVIAPTAWPVAGEVGAGSTPIGRPLGARKVFVVDESLNLVPRGVAGELYIGGELLARGYLNRPSLSAEWFVADPFSEEGGRLYRTGDLVRWNAEGQLEYLGRIDHQIKIRGFRIELGEVEAQLLAQPEVREAVVVAQPSSSGTRLVGYVAAHADHIIETAALRECLGKVLPDYMVPSALVVLDSLPLNANGKVDRKALPEPDYDSAREYVAPQSELEQTLAAIWAEVLGIEKVGRHDNFFELGGHSLLALSLLERLRTRQLNVQVRTLFQQPELAAFAQAIAQNQDRRDVVVPPNRILPGTTAISPEMLTLIQLEGDQIAQIEAAVPGGAANIQDIYPLAPLQEGMLFHHMLQQEGDAYVTSYLMSFDSEHRLNQFMASFNQVISRHDILRTVVLWEGLVEPVQVVHREAKLSADWQEPGPEAAARLNQLIHPSHYRIDVRQAPLIKALAAHDTVENRWLLQLPSHHLVLDHTTLDLIVAEIALIQQGRHDELPEPVPFRRFVAQARLGMSQAEHEAFFSKMLSDVDEPTAPFGLIDVQGNGSDINQTRHPLPSELSLRIRQQAQKHGVSATSLFHLAWALVLAKTSGREDVVFGTVLFGRMQGGEGAERAMGLFINTLPLRVKLTKRSVLQSLKDTYSGLTNLLQHEHASLSLAQRCSGLPGGTPLFSALFNYRYSQDRGTAPSMWEGMQSIGGSERTNYPIGLSVDDLGRGFELVGQVNNTVGAQRLCGYMQAAVMGIVDALDTQPHQSVTEIDLLAVAELQQLHSWGVNDSRFADPKPIHRLVEAQAVQRPYATAVILDEEHQLTYAELNTRANQLAHHLIRLGVKPEVKVGIAVQRSVEMIVGLLAILKAGGAYVPLDPDYPQDRLAYMLEDSGIQHLLTQSIDKYNILVQPNIHIIELDQLHLAIQPAHNPNIATHGDNLAYVIYTSGSTGKPKGVEITHQAITRLISHAGYAQLDTNTRMLQFAPLAFDASTFEIWGSLGNGGVLIQAKTDQLAFDDLAELIQRQRVNTAWLTAALFNQMLEGYPLALASLQQILTGGEAMSLFHAQQALNIFPTTSLINGYGPTECTTFAACHRVTEANVLRNRLPIGKPITQTQAYVLDNGLNLAPVGAAGELYLGGVGLARGYLGRPELSAERFVANPFDEAGSRLYRTGDLVRWNAEGQLEYLGRIDHQVKIRGFRIELGEVEAQLLAQPQVREAVVVARPGRVSTRLVAYVSAREGEVLEPAVLRANVSKRLPDYMVPSAIVTLESLPLNANGKVDRKALPEPARLGTEQDYEAPEGELEEMLVGIWFEVLGVEQISRHDNFFELGGNSLEVLRLQSRLQDLHSVKLSARDFFEHPTPALQATLLHSRLEKNNSAADIEQMAALLDLLES